MLIIAKDKLVITTEATIDVIKTSIEEWKFYKIGNSGEKYIKRRSLYTGVYKINVGYYHIELLVCRSKVGLIKMSFSTSKVFNGNNAIAKAILTEKMLFERVQSDLHKYINFKLLKPIDKWVVSSDETYIDIVGPKVIIDELFENISKTIVNRKKLDCSYREDGTLYFHSGKSWKRASSIIKVYYKLKELSDKKRLEELKEVLGSIQEGYTVLRIEVIRNRGKTIRELFKTEMAYEGYEQSRLVERYDKSYGFNNSNLKPLQLIINNARDNNVVVSKYKIDNNLLSRSCSEDTINIYKYVSGKSMSRVAGTIGISYQYKAIVDVFKELGIDKRKVTRMDLVNEINASSLFGKASKKTAIEIIKYINGEIDEIPVHEKRFKGYLKKLRALDVHYVYAFRNIVPIKLEEIADAIVLEERVKLVSYKAV